jgi:6-phosphogluconolactonase/glucosamine-6-phosphate isomerase/deaminase
MNSAQAVVIAMTGASKADAVKTCLEDSSFKRGDFPAQMVRCGGGVTWLLDDGAASKLEAAKGTAALL